MLELLLALQEAILGYSRFVRLALMISRNIFRKGVVKEIGD